MVLAKLGPEGQVSGRTMVRVCEQVGVPTSTRQAGEAPDKSADAAAAFWVILLREHLPLSSRAQEAYIQDLRADHQVIDHTAFLLPEVPLGPGERSVIEAMRRQDPRLGPLEESRVRALQAGNPNQADAPTDRIEGTTSAWTTPYPGPS